MHRHMQSYSHFLLRKHPNTSYTKREKKKNKNNQDIMPSLAHTRPRKYGKGSRSSRITGRQGGMALIRKYGINMKRQEFRELAKSMGWNKYN